MEVPCVCNIGAAEEYLLLTTLLSEEATSRVGEKHQERFECTWQKTQKPFLRIYNMHKTQVLFRIGQY